MATCAPPKPFPPSTGRLTGWPHHHVTLGKSLPLSGLQTPHRTPSAGWVTPSGAQPRGAAPLSLAPRTSAHRQRAVFIGNRERSLSLSVQNNVNMRNGSQALELTRFSVTTCSWVSPPQGPSLPGMPQLLSEGTCADQPSGVPRSLHFELVLLGEGASLCRGRFPVFGTYAPLSAHSHLGVGSQGKPQPPSRRTGCGAWAESPASVV